MTDAEDFWTKEHNHPSQPHASYKPKPCRACWGDAAQAEPTPAPPPPPGESPIVRPEARSLSGFTSLGEAIKRIQARRGEFSPEPPEPEEAPRSPIDNYPYCETCKGFRFIGRDLPVGHPDFGTVMTCPTCGHGIVMQRRLNAMFGELPARWRDATFDNFVATQPTQRFALDKAKEWLSDPGRPSMYLFSPSGRGKTHIAVATLRAWIESGHSGTFKAVDELLSAIKAGFDPKDGDHSATYTQMMMALRDAQLVVLDDLGSEYHRAANTANDWSSSQLFTIINSRYETNGRMIVTSNYSLRDVSDILQHERTAGRLFEMCTDKYVIDFSRLPDYRLIHGKTNG